MNRQKHLTDTAPRVHAWATALGFSWEYLVVDWSSAIPLQRETLPATEALRLLRVNGEKEWSITRAYNFACAQASGTLLLKLDADCWPDGLSLEHLERLSDNQMLQGAMGGGSEGSWLMNRQLFESVGGFHELLRGYGCDDIDLCARLRLHGASVTTLPRTAIRVFSHENDLRVGYSSSSKSGCSSAFARAWKNALVRANQVAVAYYPWSIHRPRTNYHCVSKGIWKAFYFSVPKPPETLDHLLQSIRRRQFWCEFLLLPQPLLEHLPMTWFGSFDGQGFGVRRWHRLYWHSGRRLTVVLRQLLIKLCKRVGG